MSTSFIWMITLVIFIFILYSRDIVFKIPSYKKIWNNEKLKNFWDHYWWIEQPLRYILLSWLGVFLISGFGLVDAAKEIGLFRSVWKGLAFAFIATLPMLIVPLITRTQVGKKNVEWLLFGSVIWPIGEEIAFRGFAFGMLYRSVQDSGWGFWIPALLTGIIFGVVHLQQENIKKLSTKEKTFTISVIAFGGILSAWLYASWELNLWIPIGLHMLMNLYWELFDKSGSAKGGWVSNFTREFSAILAILLTIFKDQLLPFL